MNEELLIFFLFEEQLEYFLNKQKQAMIKWIIEKRKYYQRKYFSSLNRTNAISVISVILTTNDITSITSFVLTRCRYYSRQITRTVSGFNVNQKALILLLILTAPSYHRESNFIERKDENSHKFQPTPSSYIQNFISIDDLSFRDQFVQILLVLSMEKRWDFWFASSIFVQICNLQYSYWNYFFSSLSLSSEVSYFSF